MPISVLIDTCVWLELAKDHREQPVIGALEDLVKDHEVELIVPELVLGEFARARSLGRILGAPPRRRLGRSLLERLRRRAERLTGNIVVEINPPGAGINKGVQGVIARDAAGARWILHRGRLPVPRLGITKSMFDAVTTSLRIPVGFSDESTERCYFVTPLDEGGDELRKGVAAYVAECARVRLHYTAEPAAAGQEAGVLAAEGPFDESRGSHVVGPQDAKVVQRRHADVFHALRAEIERRGITHSNARVGRHGSDLRTVSASPVLFERRAPGDKERRGVPGRPRRAWRI